MVTVTATAGGGSKDDISAMLNAKGGGAEVIGLDGDNKDCGADATSSPAVVMRLQWQ